MGHDESYSATPEDLKALDDELEASVRQQTLERHADELSNEFNVDLKEKDKEHQPVDSNIHQAIQSKLSGDVDEDDDDENSYMEPSYNKED